MVNLISEHDLVLYNVNQSVNLSISPYEKSPAFGIRLCPELTPSAGLFSFWDKSDKSENLWEVFKCEYLRELKHPDAVTTLECIQYLDDKDITVNLICTCSSNLHCHRRLLADILLEKGVQVNLV